jgi:hypothetical protein
LAADDLAHFLLVDPDAVETVDQKLPLFHPLLSDFNVVDEPDLVVDYFSQNLILIQPAYWPMIRVVPPRSALDLCTEEDLFVPGWELLLHPFVRVQRGLDP